MNFSAPIILLQQNRLETFKLEDVDDRISTRFDLKLALLFLLEVKPVHLSQNDKTLNFENEEMIVAVNAIYATA